jgi:hypothetical protein
MAPQPLEKTESAPGNGMGSEASNLLDLVTGRLADWTHRKVGQLESSLGVTKVAEKGA